MQQTIGSFKIEWQGIKKLLWHAIGLAVATVIAYFLTVATKHNFGSYEAIATAIIAWLTSFCVTFFGSYNITVPAVLAGDTPPSTQA